MRGPGRKSASHIGGTTGDPSGKKTWTIDRIAARSTLTLTDLDTPPDHGLPGGLDEAEIGQIIYRLSAAGLEEVPRPIPLRCWRGTNGVAWLRWRPSSRSLSRPINPWARACWRGPQSFWKRSGNPVR